MAGHERPDQRVICHVDLDCFYVQVERHFNPDLIDVRCAVVQYKKFKGGGIIAVSYEARAKGVTRNMRGDDAKRVCPDIQLVTVPVAHEKADLTRYRDEGYRVFELLCNEGAVCERTSIDEAYLDLTALAQSALPTLHNLVAASPHLATTHIAGDCWESNGRGWLTQCAAPHSQASEGDRLLAAGACIAAQLRHRVRSQTGYTLSAGIGHNKMLAKLASGLHKPYAQTLVPMSVVPSLLRLLPIKKLNGLRGKLGTKLSDSLGVEYVGDILQYSQQRLQELFGHNTGLWLHQAARGVHAGEGVKQKLLLSTVGNGKNFRGPDTLTSLEGLNHYAGQLASEIHLRLMDLASKHNKIATGLTVAFRYNTHASSDGSKSVSRVCTMPALSEGPTGLQNSAMKVLRRFFEEHTKGFVYVTTLYLIAGKLIDQAPQHNQITTWLARSSAKKRKSDEVDKRDCEDSGGQSSDEEICDLNEGEGDGEGGQPIIASSHHSPTANTHLTNIGQSTLTQPVERSHTVKHSTASHSTASHSLATSTYRQDTIDPDVLAEIPAELQDELRLFLNTRPGSHAKASDCGARGKRGKIAKPPSTGHEGLRLTDMFKKAKGSK